MKRANVKRVILLALLCLVAVFALKPGLFPGGETLRQRLLGRATVEDRLREYGPAARARWLPYFQKSNVAYPPRRLVLAGFKQEERLEVYAGSENGPLRFIRDYPILAMSGSLGPKLEYGDGQVPEGLYRVESLNPNSAYHLALRVDYPNAWDRVQAQKDGRTDLGGDIMIHGKSVSIGCLAMGDPAAEDLFVLAAETGIDNISVILSPVDFRRVPSLPKKTRLPQWKAELYSQIMSELNKLPRPALSPSH